MSGKGDEAMGKQSTGRNDPCPCGSGKKYKKCCLEADEAAAKAARESAAAKLAELGNRDMALRDQPGTFNPADDESFEGLGGFEDERVDFSPDVDWATRRDRRGIALAPYTWARRWDSPSFYKATKKRRQVKGFWSPKVLRCWSTEELEEKLVAAGLPYVRAEFLSAIAGLESAWEASEPWVEAVPGADEDLREFAGLAACELWRRLTPERPSLEMIDDWIVEGHEWSASLDGGVTMTAWIRAWDALQAKFTPAMKSLEDANDRIFGGRSQTLTAWVPQFTGHALARIGESPNAASEGMGIFQQLFERFPEQAADLTMRAKFGLLHMRCGQREVGIQILERLIAEAPDRAVGYVELAEELAFEDPDATDEDRQRAIRLMEQAIAYPVKDADEWDLEDRLDDMKIGLSEDLSKIPWEIPIKLPPSPGK
ncbi:MAG: SEC-C domain-containing protein [Verrucomicrobiales bacterium]|nr:SEC-C domain-containing protein [Verrucomicrobiales bacterium]